MVLRCGTRALVVVIAAAVGRSALASCLTMPMSTDAEMACCTNGHDDCMPSGQTQTCCKAQQVHDQQLIVSKREMVRLRPKLMTVSVVMASLVPILWRTGVGSDVMKRIAAPIIGGMVTSTIHVLIITPVIFYIMKARALRNGTLGPSGMISPIHTDRPERTV
jgi:hypothetical protein